MKKKTKRLFGIILLSSLIIIFYVNIEYNVLLVKINDVSAYEKNVDNYLPNYEDFPYKQYIIGFYSYDSSRALASDGISHVLEIKFQTLEKYNEFLNYEYRRFEYSDNVVSKNDYQCYLCVDEEVTAYFYKEETPFVLGMLCLKPVDFEVRYLYFKNIHSSIDKNYKNVFELTNCKW